jgi:cytoskeletal protein CcmA (bactofilin family)
MNHTLIAAGTIIHGNVVAHTLTIAGQVEGSVEADEVTVASEGAVIGPVRARVVRVFGRIEGKIEAQRVEVASEGAALGGIAAPSVLLSDGCQLAGRLDSGVPRPATLPESHPAPEPLQPATESVAPAPEPIRPAPAPLQTETRIKPFLPPEVLETEAHPAPPAEPTPAPEPAAAASAAATPTKAARKAPRRAPRGIDLSNLSLRPQESDPKP